MRAKIAGVNTVRKRLADGSIRVYYYHRDTGTRLTVSPARRSLLLPTQKLKRSSRTAIQIYAPV